MREETQIVCILFCDLKGYSQLKNIDLKNEIYKEIQAIFERVREQQAQFVKSTGDGLMAYSPTSLPLAETALRMRDTFKNTDWNAKGFNKDLMLRIGLHCGEVVVHRNKDGTVKDLIGEAIDATSRIESVADSNTVLCSSQFHDLLSSGGRGKVKGISKGKVSLPKHFGERDLLELVWDHEAHQAFVVNEQPQSTIPMPSIKKPFTDKSKKEFLYASFGVIKDYFGKALKQLEAHAPGIETTLKARDESKFICEIYRDGELKACAKIWIGSFGHSPQEEIFYREGPFRVNDDNSYNDSISVKDIGQELQLSPSLGATSMFAPGAFDTQQPSAPVQIAEYLWQRLTRVLG